MILCKSSSLFVPYSQLSLSVTVSGWAEVRDVTFTDEQIKNKSKQVEAAPLGGVSGGVSTPISIKSSYYLGNSLGCVPGGGGATPV